MTERSIDELLAGLPGPVRPDPAFEAGLRAHLGAELRGGAGVAPPRFNNRPMVTEVIELQTLTPPTSSPNPMRSRGFWWKAAAVGVLAGGVVAATVALLRNDGSTSISTDTTNVESTDTTRAASTVPATTLPTTTVSPTTIAPTPSTFAGATVQTFAIDLPHTPYFVAANGDPWVSSLAGEMVRLDPATGEIVARANVSESSPIAVDANAVWVADALTGDVVRIDPDDGSVVATIPTGIEILPNSVRFPMLEGTARSFSAIGGIDSDGESVWVGDRSGGILRIDPATNTLAGSFDVSVRPDHVRFDGTHVLIANLRGGDVAVIDAESGVAIQEITGLNDLAGAELYGGALYVQDATNGTVTRIDLATGEQTSSVALGVSVLRDSQPTLPTGLVVGAAGVLADTASEPDSIHVLDPVTLTELGTLPVRADQGEMTIAADGSAWLVRNAGTDAVHITPRPL